MHTTPIFLLALGLLVTVAMARPGRRPSPGSHHGHNENEVSGGNQGNKWATYRLPNSIRLPNLLAGKLGKAFPTYTVKKVLDGKYLLVSPALLFKLKDVDTGASTTAMPETSTSEPEVDETTTEPIDEESTTSEPEVEEGPTEPSFFLKNDHFQTIIMNNYFFLMINRFTKIKA